MHLLLVAPLAGESAAAPEEGVLNSPQKERIFRHRLDYTTRLLRQRTLRVVESVSPHGARGWLLTAGGRDFLVVRAQCDLASPTCGIDVERWSDQCVQSILDEMCVRRSPLWVARFALGDVVDIPEDWFHGPTVEVGVGASGKMHCGWGNGALVGWDELDDQTREEVVRGVVDAQHLWMDHDRVRDSVNRMSIALLRAAEAGDGSAYAKTAIREVDQVSRDLLRLETAADELRYSVQGPRRSVGVGHLEAWDFGDSHESLSGRVSALGDLAQRELRKASSASQKAMGNLLLGIGALAIVDTAVVVSAEAREVWGREPGEIQLLLAWVNGVSSDVMVTGAVTAAAVIAGAVMIRSWGEL